MSSGNFFDRIGHGIRREAGNLSGARWSNEIAHRLEQWGLPSTWASNIGTALAPTVMPHHATSYYAARQRGMDPTDARQFATSDALRTAAAAAAVYGGVEAAGAYGAGGGAASGSGATSGLGGFVPASGGASGGFTSSAGTPFLGGSSLGGFGSAGEVGGSGIANGFGAGAGGGLFNGGGGVLGGGGMLGQIDFTKLMKGGLQGMQQGQQGAAQPQTDTSLLAYLLAGRNQDQPAAQPMWTELQ